MAAPTFRALLPPVATEQSAGQTATLSATKTTTVTPIVPQAANGRPIVGFILKVTATTNYTVIPVASPGNLGDLINEFKILKSGNLTLFDPEGFDEIQRLYHIYTGLDLSDVAIAPNGTNSITTELETPVIPWYFTTAVTPQFTLYASAFGVLGSNCINGQMTVQIEFQYSNFNLVNDDQVVITTSPTALSAGVEISINQYFTVKTAVNQVWVDAAADANLTYQTYEAGGTTIFDQEDLNSLTNLEDYEPYFTHTTGFFFSQTPSGVLYPSPGTTIGSTAPNLIYKLANPIALTFYLVMAAQTPPI